MPNIKQSAGSNAYVCIYLCSAIPCYAVLHYNMPFYIRSRCKGLSSEEHCLVQMFLSRCLMRRRHCASFSFLSLFVLPLRHLCCLQTSQPVHPDGKCTSCQRLLPTLDLSCDIIKFRCSHKKFPKHAKVPHTVLTVLLVVTSTTDECIVQWEDVR